MNEALFNLGFDEVGQTSSKKYAICNKPREKKAKKTKQIYKIKEKEREIQKLIYSMKPKNYVTQLFTIKSPIPNRIQILYRIS